MIPNEKSPLISNINSVTIDCNKIKPQKCMKQFQERQGLTIEELMVFEHDPFWMWLRRIIGISFWVLMAAMLAGSVTVLVHAPKCIPFNITQLFNETTNFTSNG